MLLWASKYATAIIECSFEKDNLSPLQVTFILLTIVHLVPPQNPDHCANI